MDLDVEGRRRVILAGTRTMSGAFACITNA
jgi:hypothetical protein